MELYRPHALPFNGPHILFPLPPLGPHILLPLPPLGPHILFPLPVPFHRFFPIISTPSSISSPTSLLPPAIWFSFSRSPRLLHLAPPARYLSSPDPGTETLPARANPAQTLVTGEIR